MNARFLAKARALLSTYYAYMIEYRAELVLWALSNSLPFILLGVWHKAAAQGEFALSPVEYARYFLAVFVVRQMTVVWVIWEFEHDIITGRLSFQLLQPVDPVWRHVSMHASERLARLPFSFLLVALFFALYPDSFFVPSLAEAGFAILAMLLALLLRFLMQYTLAMASFWTERASALEQLWMLPYLFLSGLIGNLQDFPEPVREVALYTPFPYLVYFPASLLLGEDVEVAKGLLVIAAWCALFFALNRLFWRLGLKRYSAMGA